MVVIINDPEGPFSESNATVHEGNGPCKHLLGNKPGGYNCVVHSKPWYRNTPCYDHNNIGFFEECPIGKMILEREENGH